MAPATAKKAPIDRLLDLMASPKEKHRRITANRDYLAFALWRRAVTPEWICERTGIEETFDLATEIREDAEAVYGDHAKASKRNRI